MEIRRKGSVGWTGGLRDGKGAISTESGALEHYPYGFATRFEGLKGSNPEELLAAAHAACFTMSLTLTLEKAGFKADRLDTSAVVTLTDEGGGFSIPKVALSVTGEVPGLDAAQFQELASTAERNCPVSKLFRAEISLESSLG
ncbi:OsmC family protein [Sandaracinobacter sp. RS1-74]|uniref:OsmC family protein n=1 Tax=Sandaracinobacteroides sayramensis TaxID=2913411 RepID=UPI001EDB208D|nr:OsmC family protein [Sandaracinobacteroides sayramensis]MCG2841395.1 OsmC family protein [Sandaracinobacteroides sayramensis]